MPEHELWLTALFNKYLAGIGNAALSLVGTHAEHADKPWTNYVTLSIVVFVGMIALFTVLRPRLSMDNPGGTQHLFEVVYGFLKGQSEEIVGHHGPRHLHMFGTLFLFILFGNLLGVVPGFESPTMFAPVPLGCALMCFVYYNVSGAIQMGTGKYLLHFTGPVWWLAPLMVPIELISHMARPLSLTIRLFANMFAGEQIFLVFGGMVPLAIPIIFLGEHIFKAFLQAYIFVLLTMVYVQGAVAEE
ncbi:MAG: F0F1 ATP synthase subunit A, partial [bacterium]|nr:F0F1 ATP synthase subunit A [bacterium]